MGSIGIGKDRLSAVDFFGTMMVDTNSDDDFIGFVFSYQDSSNFYVVYSAKYTRTTDQGPWRIVRVASTTGWPVTQSGHQLFPGKEEKFLYLFEK